MPAGKLYLSFVLFRENPYIATTDGVSRFSAWDYAALQSKELCQG
jgi:hypothetical protein